MTSTPVWHTLSVKEIADQLNTSPQGLTSEEATRRLNTVGSNELLEAGRISPWTILFSQFKNVLVVILLIAVVLSAFMGHTVEAVAILVILLFAVGLGFVQEFRAEKAIEALKKMAAPNAVVIRDGQEQSVPTRELVPGDVIKLTAGDRIPADGRLIEAVNLRVEEAALTGESMAVDKHGDTLTEPALAVGDRKNMVYSGTAATYGRGMALVVTTGMKTEFGQVATLLQSVETGRTPLQVNLDRMGHSLAKGALAVVAVIVVLGIYHDQPVIEMIIFGIALAVAVVPEALPAVVTISLAIGVQRMVKRNALVRRLPAVETLGSTSVICSDKTGTLTKDEMTVRQLYVGDQRLDVSGAGYEPRGEFRQKGSAVEPGESVKRFLLAGTLASDAHIARDESEGRWRVKGDPTEGALVVAAAKAGLQKADLDQRYPRTDEIPFTSESKRMTTLHTLPEGSVAFSKGAPEVILASCSRKLTAEGLVPLDEAGKALILEEAREMASGALRVLAVSGNPGENLQQAQREMIFYGLAGMIDPPRPEAHAAIQTCREAGVRVVMITGDHPVTASAVARELGILEKGNVVTGAELDGLTEADLDQRSRDITVYARVSPAHKLRLVTALQKNGEIVAMTGDGVNDAPALKKADIGIAMGITGTGVSKEAAAMMLTDDNFASIVAAIEEGRGIFDNIKKYLMYLLSANIGEIGLMICASAMGIPLPLTAVQILYVNLATDGLPALALAVDPVEKNLMQRAPRDARKGLFTRPVVFLMVLAGVWSAVINLGLFMWALESGRGLTEAMTMAFVSLVLIQFIKAYNFRSDRYTAFRKPFANKWLNLAILWELLLLPFILYWPLLQKPFGTFPLTPEDFLLIAIAAFTITPVIEWGKWAVRRGWFGMKVD
jgi:Ca2+-transporting ATPase